jgi:hypothetical protein
MMGMAPPASAFQAKLERLAKLNPRYLWLLRYLESDRFFCENTLYPVRQGRTHAVVADIPSPNRDDYDGVFCVSSFSSDRSDELRELLLERDDEIGVRLVFVTSISGVGDEIRTKVCVASSPLPSRFCH